MDYKLLKKEDALKIITDYDNKNDLEFDDMVSHWKKHDIETELSPEYQAIRNQLVDVFDKTLASNGGKMDYSIDLNIGLKIYELLPCNKDFTIKDANNDDIWRYLSVIVIPDLTYLRKPEPEQEIKDTNGRISHKRFFSHKRRIWIKTLWWYVFLSWQGTLEKTRKILADNGVDNINKLIETPGKGYRVELYRKMMYEYYITRPHKVSDFPKMTQLNNARCLSVIPELTAGGLSCYVLQLCKDLDFKRKK